MEPMIQIPLSLFILMVQALHGDRPIDQCRDCDQPPTGFGGGTKMEDGVLVTNLGLLCRDHMDQGAAEAAAQGVPTNISVVSIDPSTGDATLQDVGNVADEVEEWLREL